MNEAKGWTVDILHFQYTHLADHASRSLKSRVAQEDIDAMRDTGAARIFEGTKNGGAV